MTFEDLDRELPNGFHGVRLRRVDINCGERTARLHMSFWVGDVDSPNREDYKDGTLNVDGLCYYAIDPPDPTYPFMHTGSPINVAGYPENQENFPHLKNLLPVLPKGITCYRFFVHDWNSVMHIAARDVQLSWVGDDARTASAS